MVEAMEELGSTIASVLFLTPFGIIMLLVLEIIDDKKKKQSYKHWLNEKRKNK